MATDSFLASLALIDWLPNIKDGNADWLVVLFGDLLPSMDSFHRLPITQWNVLPSQLQAGLSRRFPASPFSLVLFKLFFFREWY